MLLVGDIILLEDDLDELKEYFSKPFTLEVENHPDEQITVSVKIDKTIL